MDKAGNLHVPLGKLSFSDVQIRENLLSFMEAVLRSKPSTAKGTYVKGITITSTMSPGIKIDRTALLQLLT